MYGWSLLCGLQCAEVADAVFLMTDYAVDSAMDGEDEAVRNLARAIMGKTLLTMDGVGDWIGKRATHHIGRSGLYKVLEDALKKPEFVATAMKAAGAAGELGARSGITMRSGARAASVTCSG